MLFKTRGIVLGYFKYRETSIITKIFTSEFGLQTYIINGVRSANSKTKIAYFQPLTLLDLVVYHKKGIEIHRISEQKLAYVFKELNQDIIKITIVSFLTEILSKSLKEEEKNEELFQFIFSSVVALDHVKANDFHIKFLIKLGQYLGFMPHNAEDYLITARFIFPEIDRFSNNESFLNWLSNIYMIDFENNIRPDVNFRKVLLNSLVAIYSHFLEFKTPIKSLDIIREL